MANNDPHNLIPRHDAMYNHAKRHKNPRQPGRRKDEQAQEIQPHVRIPPAPDVDQRRAERGAEEGERDEGGEEE